MSADKINIAIAKWMGWSLHRINIEEDAAIPSLGIYPGEMDVWQNPDGEFVRCNPPNFSGDLNAIYLAEENIPPEKCDSYRSHLQMEVVSHGSRLQSYDIVPSDFLWHTTALQRARALVKALNLPIE